MSLSYPPLGIVLPETPCIQRFTCAMSTFLQQTSVNLCNPCLGGTLVACTAAQYIPVGTAAPCKASPNSAHIALILLRSYQKCCPACLLSLYYAAGRWSPEEEAGIWSRLFFSFCSGLIKMGKQKALNPEDLWDLPYSDEAATVSQVCAFGSNRLVQCAYTCLHHCQAQSTMLSGCSTWLSLLHVQWLFCCSCRRQLCVGY